MWFSNPVRGDVQEQKKVFASACVNELLDLCARENLSSTTAFFGTGQHIKVWFVHKTCWLLCLWIQLLCSKPNKLYLHSCRLGLWFSSLFLPLKPADTRVIFESIGWIPAVILGTKVHVGMSHFFQPHDVFQLALSHVALSSQPHSTKSSLSAVWLKLQQRFKLRIFLYVVHLHHLQVYFNCHF